MGAQVIITPLALDDLSNIVAFIARDNPERADTFGETLLDRPFRLGAQLMIGRIVPEEGDPAVREILHGDYRIIYPACDHPPRFFILRFWHGARGALHIVED